MGFWDYGKYVLPVAYGVGKAVAGSGITDEPASVAQQRENLVGQGNAASGFANSGQTGFDKLGAESTALRGQLRDRANGIGLQSTEQLRQGLGQLYGQQRSLAASASPANAAMAARNAAMNIGRAGYGMSGQAALAGIQERNSAMDALGNMLNQQRGQELQAALGSRQNAINAYGGGTPEKSQLEKWLPLANAGIGGLAAGGK